MDGNMVFVAFREEYEFDLFDLNKQQIFNVVSGPSLLKRG